MYDSIEAIRGEPFGLVLCCRNQQSKELTVVRKISCVASRPSIALSTLREMQILRQIRHYNVMGIKDITISPSLAREDDFLDVCLVQELMDFDFSDVIRTKISPKDCKIFLIQILRGVNIIHSANVIHRHLQPKNLLVNKELELRIGNFGHAVTLDQHSNFTADDKIHFDWYKAPEILFDNRLYGKAVDMWSIDCIFAEMMIHVPIFRGNGLIEQLKEMLRILETQVDLSFVDCSGCRKDFMDLPYSPGVGFSSLFPEADQLAIDLVKQMLVFDPLKRISAMEGLEHTYFSEFEDPLMGSVSPSNVVLKGYDQNPETVSEKILRELIWKEMVFYHPQEHCNISQSIFD